MSFNHDTDDNDNDEPVGYGRPPKEHRFKKGTSGNPKGRPRQVELSLDTIILKELEKSLVISENGSSRRVRKLEAMAAVAVNKAIKGDFKLFKAIADIVSRKQQQESEVRKLPVTFTLKLGEHDFRPGDAPSYEDDIE